ncbi:hypothetical protein CQW23_14105 [Capsicum baccatum]|uniref:Tf2-1-like SH3-like domain-containing protein n=1 Tax=Capsicum baccatum TaxID=33114 RepID=A0A2G2WI71_CAPBA|nr:hypothetical protein CQW23_14105 [Capsicum baccatum]
MPRGNGPFQVLERINDNAYKIDLPPEYQVHNTFNVCDVSLVDAVEDDQIMNLRSNSSQDGEDNTGVPSFQQVHDHSHVAKLGSYINSKLCSCKWPCIKWRSFTKVTLPIVVRRNSSYDELVASVKQSGDLDCALSNVVISYIIHSRERVNPTIINNDARVSLYIMDVDADGFRPVLRINVVDRSIEGLMNSSLSPTRCPTVDNNLNDYKSDGDHPMNMKDDCVHMEDVSSNSQDTEEDCGMGSQPVHSFSDGTNFYHDQIFADKK